MANFTSPTVRIDATAAVPTPFACEFCSDSFRTARILKVHHLHRHPLGRTVLRLPPDLREYVAAREEAARREVLRQAQPARPFLPNHPPAQGTAPLKQTLGNLTNEQLRNILNVVNNPAPGNNDIMNAAAYLRQAPENEFSD